MSSNFEKAVAVVMSQEIEGGFQRRPDDNANWTSQAAYREWEKTGKIDESKLVGTNHGISAKWNPGVDIVNLTKDEAKKIYKGRYWDEIRGDELPYEVAFAAFNTAVMSGPDKAWEQMATVYGHPYDYVVNKKGKKVVQMSESSQETMVKMSGIDSAPDITSLNYLEVQKDYLQHLVDTYPKSYGANKRGWPARMEHLKDKQFGGEPMLAKPEVKPALPGQPVVTATPTPTPKPTLATPMQKPKLSESENLQNSFNTLLDDYVQNPNKYTIGN